MKKLSFAINSKLSTSSSKPRQTNSAIAENEAELGDQKLFVTEFDPSKTLNQDSNRKLHVIPPKENEWRPHKKMKNLDLPLQPDSANNVGGALQFELASSAGDSLNGIADKISYGLNLRQNGTEEGAGSQNQSDPSSSSTENLLLEKLKYDLKRLPDDQGFDEFKDVPVEGFGAALLAGYGWCEGRGIGRNAKEDVKVKQYHKRTAMEGLGFVSTDAAKPKTGNKKDNDVIFNKDKDSKHKEKIRDDRENGDGFHVGKDVRVIGGKKESVIGSKGRVLEKLDSDWIVVKLGKSEEEINVRISDVVGLGSKEEDIWLKKVNELRRKSNHRESGRKRVSGEKDSVNNGSDIKMDRREERIAWLRNHIRVRVISKDLKGGKLYLKKGEVVDVVGPHVCDISMDESRELVQGVDQDLLETALPRRGGPALVLYGKHRGVYGNLVQKDLDREIGVVEDSDTRERVNVKLEQVAEYIGDPSYIGY